MSAGVPVSVAYEMRMDMPNLQSTLEMMRALSLSANADELAQVFARYLRDTTSVSRGLVIHRRDLARSHYRVELCADWDATNGRFIESHPDTIRQGGLLAELLEAGELRIISDLQMNSPEPARDLLVGHEALMALPIFENGRSTGTMILLSRQPWRQEATDAPKLCELAMMSGLMDRAINTQALARRLDEACATLDHELSAAAAVQRWLLPPSTPIIANTCIAASYRTARHSGGDYYDLDEMPDGRLGVLIADVSGKGAAAAVLMAVLRTIVHETARSRVTGPAALLDYADASLGALGLPLRGAFVTAFSLALDPGTGTLTYSSAGHNPPRLLRVRQRTVLPLDGAGTTPLGMFNDPCTHTEETVVLAPGDLVVLYTDGITEARSPEGEFFGTNSLDEILHALPEPVTPASAVEAVARAVGEFAGTGPLSDDQTLLALCPRASSRVPARGTTES